MKKESSNHTALSYAFLFISIIGISSSISSIYIINGIKDMTLHVISNLIVMSGSLVMLIGSIMAISKKKAAKWVIVPGTVIIGLSAAIILNYSILISIILICISILLLIISLIKY